MTTFLGPVGSLIPVKCASRLTSAGGREVTFTRTLGKQKAFLGRVRAREWQVDIGLAKPSELSGLRWLAENSTGPLVWYGPDAVIGNVLTQQQADFTPTTHDGLEGPLIEVEPGVWVKSAYSNTNSWVNYPYEHGSMQHVPVVSERPVTISAWLRGQTTRINVHWRDAGGNVVSSDSEDAIYRTVLTRYSRTLMPPMGASQMTLVFHGDQVAGPAVTITDGLMPYSPGRGAHRVVVHGLADAVIRATEEQQLGSLSFTVTEVG